MTVELLITIVTVACGVAGFFFSLRYALNRIIEAVDRLSQQMDRLGRHGAEEHKTLLNAAEKQGAAFLAAVEKLHGVLDKTREDMDEDHQEMIKLINSVREPLIALNAKLDAHVADQKKG